MVAAARRGPSWKNGTAEPQAPRLRNCEEPNTPRLGAARRPALRLLQDGAHCLPLGLGIHGLVCHYFVALFLLGLLGAALGIYGHGAGLHLDARIGLRRPTR